MDKRLASSATRWTWAALVLTLVGALFFAWQLLVAVGPTVPGPGEPPVAALPAPAAEPLPAEANFALKPAAEYAEVTERPLFVRSRRPEAVAAADPGASRAGAEAVPASNLALAGIVLTGKRRVALLRVDNEPRMMHVAEGQMAGGWKIETIAPNRVVIRRGESASTLILDYKKSGPVPIAATAHGRDGADVEAGFGGGPESGMEAGDDMPETWQEGEPVDMDAGVAEEEQPNH